MICRKEAITSLDKYVFCKAPLREILVFGGKFCSFKEEVTKWKESYFLGNWIYSPKLLMPLTLTLPDLPDLHIVFHDCPSLSIGTERLMCLNFRGMQLEALAQQDPLMLIAHAFFLHLLSSPFGEIFCTFPDTLVDKLGLMQASIGTLNSPSSRVVKIQHHLNVQSSGVSILGLVNLHLIQFWSYGECFLITSKMWGVLNKHVTLLLH